jgi:hypothetical protein
MKYFSLDQLSQGIREKHIGAERARLVEKWSRTGLLRGLDGNRRETMSQLLENQAAQVLKESASLGNGGASMASSNQIQGFSNIAFPIVRRVFGGLVANELVSIQPMSLPSGLIFYLDYTYGSNVGGDAGLDVEGGSVATYGRGQSIYNSPTGRGVQSGSLATGGMYDLVNTGYSKVHVSGTVDLSGTKAVVGAWTGLDGAWQASDTGGDGSVDSLTDFTGKNAVLAGFDPQIEADLSANQLANGFTFLIASASLFTSNGVSADLLSPEQVSLFKGVAGTAALTEAGSWGETYQSAKGTLVNLRRLTRRGTWDPALETFTPNALGGTHLMFVVRKSSSAGLGLANNVFASFAISDLTNALGDAQNAGAGAVLTIPSFETDFQNTPSPAIPEIDIKIESIAITATTRKLRARWSPELAQDLNAYHSMDAEVELTSILSEQIALEIDREILADLVTSANGANYYWSRAPGVFVNKVSGQKIAFDAALSTGPQFTGTVREWYETLVETIIDVANTIHRKTLRGSANFLVTGPDVCTILESSVLYKPKFSMDGEGQVGSPFTIGAEAVGTISNRFTVYKDPYFSRNKILVGYKGGSYLETGYVYAPYVPLIVTPTIFAQDDFTPRKGVMTRYGKKMVRSDFYGTVTVMDMNII